MKNHQNQKKFFKNKNKFISFFLYYKLQLYIISSKIKKTK